MVATLLRHTRATPTKTNTGAHTNTGTDTNTNTDRGNDNDDGHEEHNEHHQVVANLFHRRYEVHKRLVVL